MGPSRLNAYHRKRAFDRTPEPEGKRGRNASRAGGAFVVQQHAASHLHYDFRLEHAGVLLSWAVPKGPSLRPGQRRLAVRTEDHPLEYQTFEGLIPAGQYGGGTVLVWDRGTWSPEGDPEGALTKGRLAFTLFGEKLHGRFHLVRTQLDTTKKENWLLFKGRDESADPTSDIITERPESALTGRTLEQVANGLVRAPSPKEAARTPPAGASTKDDVAALVRRLPVGFPLTNLAKVLYPEVGLRKAELLAYYAAVAGLMLPHVQNRPLTLVRCPSGQSHKCFYQKHPTEGVPEVVQRVDIKEEDRALETYMFVRNMPGLLALAQLGVLEVHTWMCHADKLERPDQFVFDIDPDEGLAWSWVVEAALELRQRLDALGLRSFVKTTGGKGLHVVVPVTRKLDWETHKAFARGVVAKMAADQPGRYLINMRKDLRKGKLFLDYLRNGRGATAVAPYSTRKHPKATVALPLSWEALAAGINPESFTVSSVISNMERSPADPWQDFNRVRQAVSAAALRQVGIK